MERNRSTRRHAGLISALVACTFVTGACALSDYRGYLNHATSDADAPGNGLRIQQYGGSGSQNGIVGESKYWGGEGAFSGTGDPELDGTYSSTMEYDWRGTRTVPTGTYPSPILLTTYRNPVFAAFSGDGRVDRDGDDMRGNAGDLSLNHDPADPAGIWERRYLFVDRALGCQFFANFQESFLNDKQNNGAPPPGVVVCDDAPVEEVDNNDIDLLCTPPQPDINPATPACKAFQQDAFASLDDLFKKIWSGAIGALSARDGFTLEMNSISIDGRSIPLSASAVIDLQANGVRPMNFVIDLSSAGGQALVQALLTNTTSKQLVRLGFGFEGGMTFDFPGGKKLGFNHDVLRSILN